jgi:hypothetical protein
VHAVIDELVVLYRQLSFSRFFALEYMGFRWGSYSIAYEYESIFPSFPELVGSKEGSPW